ncbi:MAG: group 1 truncated hemoglobin [Bryobacterales bacterium]|nr:group 1 truncated hemoglobin [Bryobacterales bacterium]
MYPSANCLSKFAIGVILGAALSANAWAEDAKPRSLFERLGGEPAVRAVVGDFVDRLLKDTRVNRWFAQAAADPARLAAYKGKLGDMVCQAAGGPCQYAGMDMMAAHRGRAVTDEAFAATVENLTATLDKFKVPEAEKSQLIALLAPLKPAIVQK